MKTAYNNQANGFRHYTNHSSIFSNNTSIKHPSCKKIHALSCVSCTNVFLNVLKILSNLVCALSGCSNSKWYKIQIVYWIETTTTKRKNKLTVYLIPRFFVLDFLDEVAAAVPKVITVINQGYLSVILEYFYTSYF